MQVSGLGISSSSGGWVPSPLVIGRVVFQSPSSPAEGESATLDQSLHAGQDALWASVT